MVWPCEDGGIYTKRVHPNPSGFTNKTCFKMFFNKDIEMSYLQEELVVQLNETSIEPSLATAKYCIFSALSY